MTIISAIGGYKWIVGPNTRHFFIGHSICRIPEPNIIDISDNRLSHWQHITKCVQCIWKCLSTDYLNHLQQHSKWQFKKENIKIGTLVLIKEENLPPWKWAVVRIIEGMHGKDNKICTCKLKTAAGDVFVMYLSWQDIPWQSMLLKFIKAFLFISIS